mmetsp:Transcript_99626/g.281165  ORF Transcript_99626/g.281165 Transcript_99626/m.281165 type:complete len:234 (+) Transcript_99626:483-1184(+)
MALAAQHFEPLRHGRVWRHVGSVAAQKQALEENAQLLSHVAPALRQPLMLPGHVLQLLLDFAKAMLSAFHVGAIRARERRLLCHGERVSEMVRDLGTEQLPTEKRRAQIPGKRVLLAWPRRAPLAEPLLQSSERSVGPRSLVLQWVDLLVERSQICVESAVLRVELLKRAIPHCRGWSFAAVHPIRHGWRQGEQRRAARVGQPVEASERRLQLEGLPCSKQQAQLFAESLQAN